MKNLEISEILKKEYNILVTSIEKIKSVYRVEAGKQIYCLKVVKYELPHFLFILRTMKHLDSNGFEYVPNIIRTTRGMDYIKFDESFAYVTLWLNGRESSYENPIELSIVAKKLGQLHKCSEGFIVSKDMKPRVGWFKWIEVYRTRKGEILSFKNSINRRSKKTDVDLYYLSMIEEELQRCDRAINNLCDTNYENKMLDEIRLGGFCHHDYANHNVLIGKDNEVNIIDFDYCILDTHLHDLSSLLIRAMKYGRWNEERARIILKAYKSSHRLEQDDIKIMAAFMEFPQDYWQRGIQYYWEKKMWGEDFFLRKLNAYANDREERQEFINSFRQFKLDNL
ncbi:CotS family spore coat protein [Clostridium subterminale]|uniref:CotS family spore coat protein n=1 Tax=Clostridium subterminale TaxID=1550 RepID=A0ABN1KM79_CLOSU